MTKEITKAFILQEIQDKFKLRELEPDRFTFSEQVVPVYNVKEHLGLYRVSFAQKTATSTGGLEFFEVPDNEQWVVNGYNVTFMGVVTVTVAGVYITRVPLSDSILYLDLSAAQAVSYCVNLPKSLLLKSGDTLNICIDGYTSTMDLRLYIDVLKETIR